MPRIACPDSIEDAPKASQELLHEVERKIGRAPNMLRMLAVSPAALTGFVNLFRGLAEGQISGATRERIALAVAEISGCEYCLSSHVFFGRLAGLDNAEMTANRNGASNDMRQDAVLRLAAKIARQRGQVSDEDIETFKAAGFSDAMLLEVTMLVGMNMLANLVNKVTGTTIDFPVVRKRPTARIAA